MWTEFWHRLSVVIQVNAVQELLDARIVALYAKVSLSAPLRVTLLP